MDIAIRFKSGRLLVTKASGARLRDGILELIVFNPKTNESRVGSTFAVDTVRWARSRDGGYYIGNAELAAHE